MAARLRRDGCLGSPDDTRRYAEARLRGFCAEVFAALGPQALAARLAPLLGPGAGPWAAPATPRARNGAQQAP